MLYLGIWAGMLKNYCHICNQRPPICLIVKFRRRIRILKFGTKNVLFGCSGQQFWETIFIFEISGLEFALLQSLAQKIKILKVGTCQICKSARFAYFRAGMWNQHPRICLVVKFGAKTKIVKVFDQKCLIWVYLCWNLKIILSIWYQHPRICLTAKFRKKNENA